MTEGFPLIGFTIPIQPVAKGRPRFTRGGHVYTPSKTRKFEMDIRDRAMREMGSRAPFGGPLLLRAEFVLKRHTGKVWVSKPMPSYWSTKRPDLENYLKAVLDGMDGVVYEDDAQVCRLEAVKRHAAGGEVPGIKIEIWELPELPDWFIKTRRI